MKEQLPMLLHWSNYHTYNSMSCNSNQCLCSPHEALFSNWREILKHEKLNNLRKKHKSL